MVFMLSCLIIFILNVLKLYGKHHTNYYFNGSLSTCLVLKTEFYKNRKPMLWHAWVWCIIWNKFAIKLYRRYFLPGDIWEDWDRVARGEHQRGSLEAELPRADWT